MPRDAAHPYGAICWDDVTGVDDCITAVRVFDELRDALDFVSIAHGGQHWAVIDLRTMRILARDQLLTAPPARVPVG